MAGRHSKRGARARISEQRGPRQAVTNDVWISGWSRWRRSSAAAVVQVQRLPGVELVDARTRVAHRVTPEELLTGRQRGNYLALCGVRFLAASLVDPGRGRGAECCREQAAPTVSSGRPVPSRPGWCR
ncbi:MAG: hypothetical protein ACRDTJ_16630 [Pseudonocardiaceae bacterium]